LALWLHDRVTFRVYEGEQSPSLPWRNYSPPFWEILLDTVTAESPTGEG